jgi:DNA methylase
MRHRFHALCPYFAMFPESFVERWVGDLTKRGDVVLDPFCGRGTTPFQSLLMGRKAIGADINPVAYCITKAKTRAPSAKALRHRITKLEHAFDNRSWEMQRRELPEFFHFAFARVALRQLIYLRSTLRWQESDTDSMIAALALGALHGESQKSNSYLSNQMPRTISTKPAYSVGFWKAHGYTAPERDVFALLREKVSFRYESGPPCGRGHVLLTDFRELPRLLTDSAVRIRCVITSPPYLDVTSFEEDQWLRLWFLGGQTRPTYRVVSKDDRHEKAEPYWDLISDMWRVLGQVLAEKANVVIRIGGKKFDPAGMAKSLQAASVFSRRKVSLVYSEISDIKGKQTGSFRPGSKGCLAEGDFHFRMN